MNKNDQMKNESTKDVFEEIITKIDFGTFLERAYGVPGLRKDLLTGCDNCYARYQEKLATSSYYGSIVRGFAQNPLLVYRWGWKKFIYKRTIPEVIYFATYVDAFYGWRATVFPNSPIFIPYKKIVFIIYPEDLYDIRHTLGTAMKFVKLYRRASQYLSGSSHRSYEKIS